MTRRLRFQPMPFPFHAMLNAAVFPTLGATEEDVKTSPPSRRSVRYSNAIEIDGGSSMQSNGLLYGDMFMILANLMRPSATAVNFGAGIFAVRRHVTIRVCIRLNLHMSGSVFSISIGHRCSLEHHPIQIYHTTAFSWCGCVHVA